ncbi:MAG: hypothetical protein ACOY4P_07410, partial [Pseudomonadota bacterium]
VRMTFASSAGSTTEQPNPIPPREPGVANNPPGDDMTTETEELPPLHALDKAANLAGWDCWNGIHLSQFHVRESVIAHARTIAKYEPAPDPDKREREELARMLDAWGSPNVAKCMAFAGVPLVESIERMLDAYKAILKERRERGL